MPQNWVPRKIAWFIIFLQTNAINGRMTPFGDKFTWEVFNTRFMSSPLQTRLLSILGFPPWKTRYLPVIIHVAMEIPLPHGGFNGKYQWRLGTIAMWNMTGGLNRWTPKFLAICLTSSRVVSRSLFPFLGYEKITTIQILQNRLAPNLAHACLGQVGQSSVGLCKSSTVINIYICICVCVHINCYSMILNHSIWSHMTSYDIISYDYMFVNSILTWYYTISYCIYCIRFKPSHHQPSLLRDPLLFCSRRM